MNLRIHEVAGNTCLVDFERDGYGPQNPDPEGFTQLMDTNAAIALRCKLMDARFVDNVKKEITF